MLEVVAHVVAAEGQHGHGVTADHAHSAGGGGGGLRSHDGAYEHAVVPIAGLVHQGRGLGAAAAEDDGGNRHAFALVELSADAGAVLGGSGEAAVGMGALLLGGLAIPGLAGPIQSVLGRILVQAFPPHGVVVQVVGHVGEDGALLGGNQSVGVGLHVGAGGHAEEAVLGVDGVQLAIGALAHPGDVVAHGPNLVALIAVAFRRDEHGQVGLAAGRGEGGGDVLHLALGILNAQDEHVLGHPALVFALVGGDAQGEALLAQQHVAAVTGVHADDIVVLGEVADVPLLLVDVALAVQALHPVGAVAQHVQHSLAYPGHNGHVQHHVDGVGDLQADLGQGGAYGAHGVGDDIHGTALVAAPRDVEQHLIGLLGVHPVVGGASVLFLAGADEGAAFHTGHVVDGGAVQVAARQLLLVELNHFAGFAGLLAKALQLLLRAVDPDDLIGGDQLFHFVKPSQHGLIVGHLY